MAAKRCSKCHIVKDLTCFHLGRHTRDGRQGYCHDCVAAYTGRSNYVFHYSVRVAFQNLASALKKKHPCFHPNVGRAFKFLGSGVRKHLSLQRLKDAKEVKRQTRRQFLPRVYFISSGLEGPIKIGFTEHDVASRLEDLQIGNPETLSVIKCVLGPVGMEKRLHKWFKDIKIKGEWYKRTPALLSYITKLKDAYRSVDELPIPPHCITVEREQPVKESIDQLEGWRSWMQVRIGSRWARKASASALSV